MDVEPIITLESYIEGSANPDETPTTHVKNFIERLRSQALNIKNSIRTRFADIFTEINNTNSNIRIEVRVDYGIYNDYIDINAQNTVHNFFRDELGLSIIEINTSNKGNTSSRIIKEKIIEIPKLPTDESVKYYYQMKSFLEALHTCQKRIQGVQGNGKDLDRIIRQFKNGVIKFEFNGRELEANLGIFETPKGDTKINETFILDKLSEYFTKEGEFLKSLPRETRQMVINTLLYLEQWLLIRDNPYGGDTSKFKGVEELGREEIKRILTLKRIIKSFTLENLIRYKHTNFSRAVMNSEFILISNDELEAALIKLEDELNMSLNELDIFKIQQPMINRAEICRRGLNEVLRDLEKRKDDNKVYTEKKNIDILDILKVLFDDELPTVSKLPINIKKYLEYLLEVHFIRKEEFFGDNEMEIKIVFATGRGDNNPMPDDWLTGLAIINKVYELMMQYYTKNNLDYASDTIFDDKNIIIQVYEDLSNHNTSSIRPSRLSQEVAFFSHVIKWYKGYLFVNNKINQFNLTNTATVSEINEQVLKVFRDTLADMYHHDYKNNTDILTSLVPLGLTIKYQPKIPGQSMSMFNLISDIESHRLVNKPKEIIHGIKYNTDPLLFTRRNSMISNGISESVTSIKNDNLVVGKMIGLNIEPEHSMHMICISQDVNVATNESFIKDNYDIKLSGIYGLGEELLSYNEVSETGKRNYYLNLKPTDAKLKTSESSNELIPLFFKIMNNSVNINKYREELNKSLDDCIKKRKYVRDKTNKLKVATIYDKKADVYRIFTECLESLNGGDNNSLSRENMSWFLSAEYLSNFYNLLHHSLHAPFIVKMDSLYQTAHYITDNDFVPTRNRKYKRYKYNVVSSLQGNA